MRRRVWVLVMAGLLSAVAGWGMYRLRMRETPVEWMGRRFGLRGVALQAFIGTHEAYTSQCAATCRRILEADRALAEAVLGSPEVTPEIRAAMGTAAALDAECRVNMLRHFYEAAALLPEDRREEYLRRVLPLVLRGAMDMELPRP